MNYRIREEILKTGFHYFYPEERTWEKHIIKWKNISLVDHRYTSYEECLKDLIKYKEYIENSEVEEEIIHEIKF